MLGAVWRDGWRKHINYSRHQTAAEAIAFKMQFVSNSVKIIRIRCGRTTGFLLEQLLLSYTGVTLMQLAIKRAERPVVLPVEPEKQWLLKSVRIKVNNLAW